MDSTAAKSSRWGTMLPFIRPARGYFALALIASMLGTVFTSLTPQVIKITVDSVLGTEAFALPAPLVHWLNGLGGRAFLREHLALPAALLLVFALLAGVCNYLCQMAAAKGAEGTIARLRSQLYRHIQNLPYQWHIRHQTGDIIQRCTSDVEVVRSFVSSQLLEVFRTTFLILLSMGILFSMDAKLTWIALAFIPIILCYSGVYYNRISHKFRHADEAEGVLSAVVQENLTGVRVVRAFGREAYEIEKFDQKNQTYANLWMNLGLTLGSYWGLEDLITGLQIVTIVVFGTAEAVSGAITLGEFITFVSYNATLMWPIRSLGRILSEMSKAGVSADRLAYLLNAQEEQDAPNALTPALDGDIAFEQVTFGYEGNPPVLRNLSFTIPAGNTFAILGGTGSGKSTLIHLLDRLYDLTPDGGRITIGGTDIAQIKREWLRQNIGIVLQEPFLFSQTIGENIAAGLAGATLESIRQAAATACVDEAITEFPQGYDTMVGERGVTLSGGQKQRVAIARALIRKAPILIFDDSLSAVDAETDSRIRAALQEEMGQRTILLISHRITTLMQADRILVLENGGIAQLGTHEELIAQPGIYREIYEIQLRSDDRQLLEQERSPCPSHEKGGNAHGRL